MRLLIQDPAFLDMTIDNLSPAFFESAVHRWFVRKVSAIRQTFGSRATKHSLDLEMRRDVADKTLVEDEAPKYRAFLERIDRPVVDAPYVKQQISDFIKRQKQRTAIIKASDLFDANKPAHEIDAAFLQAISFTPRSGDAMTFIGPDLKARIKRRMRVVRGITTGVDALDERFDHRGIPEQFSGCIIAPPGRGKTLWLVVLGIAALKHNFKVLHYTLEMPKDMVLDRYDAGLSGIELRNLRRKPKSLKKAWSKLGDIGNNLVVREESPGLTVNDIESHLRELESMGFVPDLLIIDYADEMAPAAKTRREDGSYEKQGQVYVEINKLIKERKLACWTASQAKRQSLEKGILDLDDIGDSWNKAKKAFIVLALCQTRDERNVKQMRVSVLKNRDGYVGGEDLYFTVDSATIRVKGITKEESVYESEMAARNARKRGRKTMQPKPDEIKKPKKEPKAGSEVRKHKLEGSWAQLMT